MTLVSFEDDYRIHAGGEHSAASTCLSKIMTRAEYCFLCGLRKWRDLCYNSSIRLAIHLNFTR